MGNARTSNKDILEALQEQTKAIAALAGALAQNAPVQTQAPTPVNEPAPPTDNGYDVPKGYMDTMDRKVSKLTADDGQARVLYLRRNLNGEIKLAYALKSRWDEGIKDNGMLGAVKVYS